MFAGGPGSSPTPSQCRQGQAHISSSLINFSFYSSSRNPVKLCRHSPSVPKYPPPTTRRPSPENAPAERIGAFKVSLETMAYTEGPHTTWMSVWQNPVSALNIL